jgi:hypothetical protein
MAQMREGQQVNKGITEAIDKLRTQKNVAVALGRDEATIWRYRYGHVEVPVTLALKLEDEFGVARWKTRPDLWNQEAHG